MSAGQVPARMRGIQYYIVKLNFQWKRIARIGFFGILTRLARKLLTIILAMLFLPFSLVIFCLGFRRFMLFTDRIGHLAIEPDTLIKAITLKIIKPRRWIVLAPKHRVANQHLLSYWDHYFTIIRSAPICFLLNSLMLWPFLRFDVTHFINRNGAAQFAYEVNTQWGSRPPILQLNEADNNYASVMLAKMGIPKDAWFVCVHARDGGYSPIDEPLHAHRNGNIENLYAAITAITQRGGWVIRLGDSSQSALSPMTQVIDYAHHPLRSERLDILLCARAKFMLGNTSGIFIVCSVFGVPCALANMIPLPTLGFLAKDIAIPKLYRCQPGGAYLSFNEIMNSPLSTYRYAELYKSTGLIIEENTAEDILALTEEMLDNLDGIDARTEDDYKRQARFMSLFNKRHYAAGACSKISYRFLRRYQELLLLKLSKTN